MAVCGTCQHWREEVPFSPKDEDDIGDCAAMDTVQLPHSWRWCRREVMGVERGETSDCPLYVEVMPGPS
jgi:hypothetical protein